MIVSPLLLGRVERIAEGAEEDRREGYEEERKAAEDEWVNGGRYGDTVWILISPSHGRTHSQVLNGQHGSVSQTKIAGSPRK